MNKKLKLAETSQYLNYLREEERSKVTLEKYERDIKHFYQFLPKGKELTKENVIAYKEKLVKDYTSASVNSMLAPVNGLLEFLGQSHCKVKKLKVQRKMCCPEEKELTKAEYMKLLQAAMLQRKERLYMIIQTIGATGIRISELAYFTVEGVKQGRIEVDCKRKVRTIIIPKALRKQLLKYAKKKKITSGAIFITRNGKTVDRSNVWSEMKALCKAAGVSAKKVFPHNLRHLFARVFYQRKKDISKLADILGHSNIETTRIYTISSGKEHEREIAGLGLIL